MASKKNLAREFLEHSIVIRIVKNFYLYRLTHMGKYLLFFGVLSPLFGAFVISSSVFLYVLVAFTLLITLLDPLLCRLFLPKLKVQVNTPTRTAAGSVVTQEIVATNPSGKNAYLTYFRELRPPSGVTAVENQGMLVPLIKRGDEVRFKLNLQMEKRGEYTLHSIRVDSSFPMGILRTGYRCPIERRILVYPTFKPLLEFNVPAGRKLQPGGIALASNVGESTEFLGTREFRDGDDPRFIHWASWARMNKPIIKEFQEEFFTRIALFIDSYVPDNAGEQDYESFEALLSLAASISDYLQRQEYIIDILCAGPQIYYLQAGRALAYLDQILDILACLDVCRNKPYDTVEPHLMEDLSQVSTVIVLLLGWDEERKNFLLHIRDMGVDLRVFLVSDAVNPEELAAMEGIFGGITVLDSDAIKKGVDQL